MGYFSWEILIHRHWRQEVPFSYRFAVNQLVWRGSSRIFMTLNHAFDFGRNTSILANLRGIWI